MEKEITQQESHTESTSLFSRIMEKISSLSTHATAAISTLFILSPADIQAAGIVQDPSTNKEIQDIKDQQTKQAATLSAEKLLEAQKREDEMLKNA